MNELSPQGKYFIKKLEGLRLQAYKCSAGVWTIGYGHTRTAKENDIILTAKANMLFDEDIFEFEKAVNEVLPDLPQNKFDALVSFAFNVGVNAFKNSTLVKKAVVDIFDLSIKSEFLKWCKIGNAECAGLKSRREKEANLYFQ